MTIFFCIFEAIAYVSFGALSPSDASGGTYALLVGQLAFGAFLVLLMDEVVSKWGIGSGVSLFIAAGVTKQIFVRAFNPITPTGQTVPAGLIPQFFVFMGMGEMFQAAIALLPIIATIVVFMIVVYVQAIKVEIPLAFASIRGFSRRWPLNLVYTSNIPVILIAALIANLQLMGSIMAKTTTEEGLRCGLLGCFDTNGAAVSGFASFLRPSSDISIQVFALVFMLVMFVGAFLAFYLKGKSGMKILGLFIAIGFVAALGITAGTTGLPVFTESMRSIVYLLILVVGSTIFSIFWVTTSGMDARSVAEQIEGIGMHVPGFRRDPRIIEQVLNRYIPILTVLSGVFIGLIASLADFTSALGTGTGILLTVMIIYNFYEQISTRYVEDMHPAMRKFFE